MTQSIRITRLWDMPATPKPVHEAWLHLNVAIDEVHIAAARHREPHWVWDDLPRDQLRVAAAKDVYAALEQASQTAALIYWRAKDYPVFLFPVDCSEVVDIT